MNSILTRIKNRRRRRRLELTVAGRYAFALVVLLCFVAISSQNNVLYLITSFVLAVFIVAGFTSDYALYSIRMRHTPGRAQAGLPCDDEWVVENRGRLPLFGISIGEFDGKNLTEHLRVGWIPARSSALIRSQARFPMRGQIDRQSLYARTLSPFGFVAKTLFKDSPRSRLIEPRPHFLANSQVALIDPSHNLSGAEFIGDIREGNWHEDARDLIVAQVARDPTTPRFRKRSVDQKGRFKAELNLSQSQLDAETFEAELSHLSFLFRERNLSQFLLRSEFDQEVVTVNSAEDLATINNPFRNEKPREK